MTGPANHACAPIADRTTDDATIVASDTDQFAAALDDWKSLTAWALVGIAARALELGVEYVNDRHQFGRPIGSFQSIQHGLADLVGMIDGARLLAGKAAWECDHPSFDDPTTAATERARLASMAFSFSTEVAKLSTARALHYHGGYGVMLEYDIQLLYRRARGWPLVLHDLDHELLDLADLVLGPTAANAATAGSR
jgi:alkylation response protein AidB-like acyl-CoA dehydrogenase